MGNSRRKLFTSIVSFALVAVIGVGAIVAVFAALIGHVSSGFNISYTASNVECVVSGSYTTKLGVKDQSLGPDITFSLDDPNDATKSFAQTPQIKFESFSDYVEFHYTIQNLGKNSFNVSLTQTGLDNPNFKVEYTKAVRASGDENAQFNFSNSKARLMDSYVTENGGAKEYLDIGVKISLVGKPTESATVEGTFSFKLDGLALPPEDIWDDDLKVFNRQNVDKLLKMISADETASVQNMTEVDRLATEKTSAAVFHNNVVRDPISGVDKKAGDIVVTLGGLTWHACYLSRAKGAGEEDGDVILTLWLTSSQQKPFEGLPADEGDYYGFLDGSLYSDWAANWSNSSTSLSYPSSMYGTSYIRAVTLNNGGEYTTNGTTLSTCIKNKENVFALFTIEELGFTDYIVKPEKVTWQEYGQSAKEMFYNFYNLSNENWSSDTEKVPDTGFYSSAYNYANKGEYNSAWKDDYLWLPSLTETGFSDTNVGIWQLNVDQRKNGTLTGTSSVGKVGLTSDAAYNNSWLRSSQDGSHRSAKYLSPTGLTSDSIAVMSSYAVRPALHLNLTKIATALAAA